MARLILKTSFMNNKNHKSNLAEYIATRDGVEFNNFENEDITEKQNELIENLISEYEFLKFEDSYKKLLDEKNKINASDFLTESFQLLESKTMNKEIYMKYIAERPNVEKYKTHGLFNQQGFADLDKELKDIKKHEGIVWANIISLSREDAEKTGYDNAKAFQILLSSKARELSELMNIEYKNFVWNGAFHNEGNHPHIHLLCYSKNKDEGFFNKDDIKKFKSSLMNEIFKDELIILEKNKGQVRDDIRNDFKQLIEKKLDLDNRRFIEKNLKSDKRNYYKYQLKDVKKKVNIEMKSIFNSSEEIQNKYRLYKEYKKNISSFYSDKEENLNEIEKEKIFNDEEFNSIFRNSILDYITKNKIEEEIMLDNNKDITEYKENADFKKKFEFSLAKAQENNYNVKLKEINQDLREKLSPYKISSYTKSEYNIKKLSEKIESNLPYNEQSESIKKDINNIIKNLVDEKIIENEYIEGQRNIYYLRNSIVRTSLQVKNDSLYIIKKEIYENIGDKIKSLSKLLDLEKQKKIYEKNISNWNERLNEINGISKFDEIRKKSLYENLERDKPQLKNLNDEINKIKLGYSDLEKILSILRKHNLQEGTELIFNKFADNPNIDYSNYNKISSNKNILSYSQDKELSEYIKSKLKKDINFYKNKELKENSKEIANNFKSLINENYDNENKVFKNSELNRDINNLSKKLNNPSFNFYDIQNEICKEELNKILNKILENRYGDLNNISEHLNENFKALNVEEKNIKSNEIFRKELMNVLLYKATDVNKEKINKDLNNINVLSNKILNKLISKDFKYDDKLTSDLFELSKKLKSNKSNNYFHQDKIIKQDVDNILDNILNGKYDGESSQQLKDMYEKYKKNNLVNKEDIGLRDDNVFKEVLKDRILSNATDIKREFYTYQNLSLKYEYLNKVNKDNLKYSSKNLCLNIADDIFKNTKEEMEGEGIIKSRNKQIEIKSKAKKKRSFGISF